MTERQIIEGMLDLLSDESKWTQGAFARDASGAKATPDSPDACCWCLEGARLRAASGDDFSRPGLRVWRAVVSVCGRDSAARFNDAPETTFEDVRELLLKVRDQFDD